MHILYLYSVVYAIEIKREKKKPNRMLFNFDATANRR